MTLKQQHLAIDRLIEARVNLEACESGFRAGTLDRARLAAASARYRHAYDELKRVVRVAVSEGLRAV